MSCGTPSHRSPMVTEPSVPPASLTPATSPATSIQAPYMSHQETAMEIKELLSSQG